MQAAQQVAPASEGVMVDMGAPGHGEAGAVPPATILTLQGSLPLMPMHPLGDAVVAHANAAARGRGGDPDRVVRQYCADVFSRNSSAWATSTRRAQAAGMGVPPKTQDKLSRRIGAAAELADRRVAGDVLARCDSKHTILSKKPMAGLTAGQIAWPFLLRSSNGLRDGPGWRAAAHSTLR